MSEKTVAIVFAVAAVLVVMLNGGCPEGTSRESVYHGRSVSTVCVP